VHCWVELQSVHGFRCYDNIAPNAKCQRVFVLALRLVPTFDILNNFCDNSVCNILKTSKLTKHYSLAVSSV